MLSSTSDEVQLFLALSVWTAERSMPQDSIPIIFLAGGEVTIATSVLPRSSSGL